MDDYIAASLDEINKIASEYGVVVHLSYCSVGKQLGNLLLCYGEGWSSFLVFRCADNGYEENVRNLLDGVLGDIEPFKNQIQRAKANPRMRSVENFELQPHETKPS
jgi:hypothetical protein